MGAPIKNTCPDIDRALRHLKDALSEIKYNVEDKMALINIEYDIDAAMGYFEDLRNANSTLRDWGEDLEDQLQAAAEQISDLEKKIEEPKNEPVNA